MIFFCPRGSAFTILKHLNSDVLPWQLGATLLKDPFSTEFEK